jgi:hypothetical protein
MSRLRITFGLVILVSLVAACGSSPNQSMATQPIASATPLVTEPELMTTVQIIAPCVDQFGVAAVADSLGKASILVDGKEAGKIQYCSHTTIRVAPGERSIGASDPNFDLPTMFGGKRQVFSLPPKGFVALLARGGNGFNNFIEIDAPRAKAETGLIDAKRAAQAKP